MAKAILNRAKDGYGYTAENGRFTVRPAYAPSIRGGSVSRPSHWIVTDTQAPKDKQATEYPSLDRVRDMFRERRQLGHDKPATTTPKAPAKDGSRTVTLADGRQIRLTLGEIKAFRRYIAMNGASLEKVQYDPGHVRYDTVNKLVEKGLFRRDDRRLEYLAPGVLPEDLVLKRAGAMYEAGHLLAA